MMKYCPCGTGKYYLNCCGLYLEKGQMVDKPEILMRSRYTAFVERNTDYIRKTMREPALQHFDERSITKGNPIWQGLEVLQSYMDIKDPTIGYVEFIARYKQNNKECCIHELSEFHCIDGRWYYVDGKHFA